MATHTNQTIGGLLNATFGNAPELLISTAALSEGYYRVVQLTLLGSMLTNLLFVFGLSCFIGGMRYQVQTLRITSGNASIGMLMVAVAGLGLPAALVLSDEMVMGGEQRQYVDKNGDGVSDIVDGPTQSMLGFSRFNAAIMVVGYFMYLLFQLGTHREEFEDVEEEDNEDEVTFNVQDDSFVQRSNAGAPKQRSRRNKFCNRLFGLSDSGENSSELLYQRVVPYQNGPIEMEMAHCQIESHHQENSNEQSTTRRDRNFIDDEAAHSSDARRKRFVRGVSIEDETKQIVRPQDIEPSISKSNKPTWTPSSKSHCSDGSVERDPSPIMIPISGVSEQGGEGEQL